MQVKVAFFKNENDPIAFVSFNEGIKGFHIPHGIVVAANITQCVVNGKMGAFMRAPFIKIFADEVLLIGGDGTLRRRPQVEICPGPVEKYYVFCNGNGDVVSSTEITADFFREYFEVGGPLTRVSITPDGIHEDVIMICSSSEVSVTEKISREEEDTIIFSPL